MKYVVFAFMDYYPSGGVEDFVAIEDSFEEAKERASAHLLEEEFDTNYQVVELSDEGFGKRWFGRAGDMSNPQPNITWKGEPE